MTTVHSRRTRKLSVTQLEGRDNPTPVLGYSTYLPNAVLGEAVDSAGNAYLARADATVTKLNPTGTAAIYSTQLTGGSSAVDVAVDTAGDAFVLLSNGFNPMTVEELDPTGTNVLYSYTIPGTSSGGSAWSNGTDAGIAVDGAGNVYVTGIAGAGLPTTSGAFQATDPDPNGSAFLVELNPALSGSASVAYCTYLGGSNGGNGDGGTSVAVDSAGNAYVAGYASSTDFPTTAGAFQRTLKGGSDVFVAKFNPNLSGSGSLVYSTYLGGSGSDGRFTDTLWIDKYSSAITDPRGAAIAVDASGSAYVTGETGSSDFPATAGAYLTKSGKSGGGLPFVTKMNPAGSGLVYSTYLCQGHNDKTGPKDSYGTSIAIDSAGDAYITGLTSTSSFPLVNPLQSTYGGLGDVFVSTLNPTGKSLLFSTYMGGPASDVGMAIAVGPNNNTYVGGATFGTFPLTAGAYQTSPGNGFAFMIDPPVEPPHVLQSVNPLPQVAPPQLAFNSSAILSLEEGGTLPIKKGHANEVLPAATIGAGTPQLPPGSSASTDIDSTAFDSIAQVDFLAANLT
jgi:hypothetical protein